ncbi:MAG: siphovirus Gp157 family protein [Gallionellaceae bacterium]|jgi:hypothetical protein|nr:siphovirus Gp157 family protein [Gallionellaceae bacterium]
MTIALYKLADEYIEASNKLADLDLPPETVADTLEGLSGELETKAINVAAFIRNLETSADAMKEAANELLARSKATQRRADDARQYLLANMDRTGITEIECPYYRLRVRDNPGAVVIDDAGAIPAEFMRQPEPPPPAPDKKAIADAIKAGRQIDGAHLAFGKRLEIK